MSADTPARDQEKFVLRLPDGMRDRLRAEAESNKRSMNAEIIARLEASFEEGAGRPSAEWITKIATMAVERAIELMGDESTAPSKPRHPRMPMLEDLPPQDEVKADRDQVQGRQQAARHASKKNT